MRSRARVSTRVSSSRHRRRRSSASCPFPRAPAAPRYFGQGGALAGVGNLAGASPQLQRAPATTATLRAMLCEPTISPSERSKFGRAIGAVHVSKLVDRVVIQAGVHRGVKAASEFRGLRNGRGEWQGDPEKWLGNCISLASSRAPTLLWLRAKASPNGRAPRLSNGLRGCSRRAVGH